MPASTDKNILPTGTLDLAEQIFPGRKALVSRVDDRQWIKLPTECISIRVRSTDVGSSYSIIEGILAPLSGPPLHIHQNEDEIFEVLEATSGLFAKVRCLTPGGDKRGHSKRCASYLEEHERNSGCRVLAVLSPGGLEAMFEEFEGNELAELEEIARRYGTIFVGPPL